MDTPRAALLKAVLPESPHLNDIILNVTSLASAPQPTQAPADLQQKAILANALANMTNDNEQFVKNVVADPRISTLRDAAFHVDTKAASLLADKTSPIDVPSLQAQLFKAQPSAVIHRQVSDGRVSFT
jgi:hypothetical protein